MLKQHAREMPRREMPGAPAGHEASSCGWQDAVATQATARRAWQLMIHRVFAPVRKSSVVHIRILSVHRKLIGGATTVAAVSDCRAVCKPQCRPHCSHTSAASCGRARQSLMQNAICARAAGRLTRRRGCCLRSRTSAKLDYTVRGAVRGTTFPIDGLLRLHMQCCLKPAQRGDRRSPLATMQGSETSDMCSSRGGHHRKDCRDIGGCTRERDQQRCLHFQRQWRLERRQQRRQRPGGSGLAVGRIVRRSQGKANRRSWAFYTVAAAPARRQPLSVAACEIQCENAETHFGVHVEDPFETIFPQAYAAFFGVLGFGLLPLQGQTRLADLPYFLSLAAMTIYIGAHKGLNSKQRQTISLEQVSWLRIHHWVLLQARMVALQKLPGHSGPRHRVSATQICCTQD